jgi:hypothetical protein
VCFDDTIVRFTILRLFGGGDAFDHSSVFFALCCCCKQSFLSGKEWFGDTTADRRLTGTLECLADCQML